MPLRRLFLFAISALVVNWLASVVFGSVVLTILFSGMHHTAVGHGAHSKPIPPVALPFPNATVRVMFFILWIGIPIAICLMMGYMAGRQSAKTPATYATACGLLFVLIPFSASCLHHIIIGMTGHASPMGYWWTGRAVGLSASQVASAYVGGMIAVRRGKTAESQPSMTV